MTRSASPSSRGPAGAWRLRLQSETRHLNGVHVCVLDRAWETERAKRLRQGPLPAAQLGDGLFRRTPGALAVLEHDEPSGARTSASRRLLLLFLLLPAHRDPPGAAAAAAAAHPVSARPLTQLISQRLDPSRQMVAAGRYGDKGLPGHGQEARHARDHSRRLRPDEGGRRLYPKSPLGLLPPASCSRPPASCSRPPHSGG